MTDAVFYLTTRAEGIYVLHAFEKKTQKTSHRIYGSAATGSVI